MSAPGHKPGHRDGAGHRRAVVSPSAGVTLDWSAYLDGLVEEHRGLASLCARLVAQRGFREDSESVGRALRRLRTRGSDSGGKWGDRLLSTFGLPRSVTDRLRFMGTYHSRFVDLPVPICLDLVQLWDRPPTAESRAGRRWLSLARATLALREERVDEARAHLDTAAATSDDDPRGRVELLLGLGLLEARSEPRSVPAVLSPVPALLERIEGDDGDCLRARYTGQVAHALFRAGEDERALALHEALAEGAAVAAFARSRRANGLAYGHLRRGEQDAALVCARRAATFAGDAGHVRLRAMALLMVARAAGPSPEGREALERAAAIAHALGDVVLLRRCGVVATPPRAGSCAS